MSSKAELLYNMEHRGVEPRIKREEGRRQFLLGFVTALCLMYLMDLGFEAYMFATSRESVQVASGKLHTSWPTPPPHTEVARVARYVVHISDWASVATISTAAPIKGFPFANTASVSDGPVGLSSGTLYFYITRLDLSGQDLMTDARTTVSLSEAQSDYCHTAGYDPEDPRCARIMLSGTVDEVKNGTEEATFARNALFSRHPVMETWPADHHFFFAKLNISHIYVLDFFGGAAEVSVQDYYQATPFP